MRSGGWFLHTDLLPGQRWMEVHVLLEPLGFTIREDRDITPNVLASCDEVAATEGSGVRRQQRDDRQLPRRAGSAVYEQMRSGAWEYRILRARRAIAEKVNRPKA